MGCSKKTVVIANEGRKFTCVPWSCALQRWKLHAKHFSQRKQINWYTKTNCETCGIIVRINIWKCRHICGVFAKIQHSLFLRSNDSYKIIRVQSSRKDWRVSSQKNSRHNSELLKAFIVPWIWYDTGQVLSEESSIESTSIHCTAARKKSAFQGL